MDLNFIDFEQPIAELEAKINELRHVGSDTEINIQDEIATLESKSLELTRTIFAKLTPWQVSQVARHPLRPYFLDYVEQIFDDVEELHGDRAFADDSAIITAVARLDDKPVVLIGHQKGRDTNEKLQRNFGMPRPEGYRKSLRIMELAERFKLPVLTFIDTPGAYPGVGAEERGQSEAIARNLREMSQLKTPIISTVIGEGGSGGAYSVISPEGCASILWKDATKASLAAEAMAITSKHLKKLDLIDGIIDEPLGGAHRDPEQMAATLRESLISTLGELERIPMKQLLEQRYQRLMSYGSFAEA